MKYLITGLAGSGKSAIARALQERGYTAFDSDKVPGLTGWYDTKTGLPIEVDLSGSVDYSRIALNWDTTVLDKLLSSVPDPILCGSSGNALSCMDHFDMTFILTLDRETHKHRIMTRTDNDYGKHPDALRRTLDNQPGYAEGALQRGAIAIDAAAPIETVVDEIVRYVRHDT